jgi:hypothetical protein
MRTRPVSAEEVARQCPAWVVADPAAIDLFASVSAVLWGEIAREHPGESWMKTLAVFARQWHEHRSATVSA